MEEAGEVSEAGNCHAVLDPLSGRAAYPAVRLRTARVLASIFVMSGIS